MESPCYQQPGCYGKRRIDQLNLKTIVRRRQWADAARNMLGYTWNNTRKNQFRRMQSTLQAGVRSEVDAYQAY
jgi:hypothetical protein